MSGQRKKGKGKGKGKDKEDDGAGAFAVDFSKEKGEDIYIPGSFWGLAGDGASKMWKCSVFQYDPNYKFSDTGLATNSVPLGKPRHLIFSCPDLTKAPPPEKEKETED